MRATLVAALGTFDASLRRHPEHEERDAPTLVQQYLSQADWKWLEKEHFSKGYKLREIPFALCFILHELPDEAQESVFSMDAAPPRRVWNFLRPGFERRERQAFRYVQVRS